MSARYRRRIRKFSDINENDMQSAINAVLLKNFPIKAAAHTYGVSLCMLQSRIDSLKSNSPMSYHMRRSPTNHYVSQVFTTKEEKDLAEYLMKYSKVQPLTMNCIRKLAYEYALKIPHCRYPKKWDHMQMTGAKWAYSYRLRHPQINIVCGNCGGGQTKENGSPETDSIQPDSEETPASITEVFEGRVIIVRVYHYLEKEFEYIKFFNKDGGDLSPLANILKRTAAATGVNEQTVNALLEEHRLTKDPLKQERPNEHCHADTMHMEPNNNTEYDFEKQVQSYVGSTTVESLEQDPNEQQGDCVDASRPAAEGHTEPYSYLKQRKKKQICSPTALNATSPTVREASALDAPRLYGSPPLLREKRDYSTDNGSLSILNPEEEKRIADWIHCLGEAGFRVTKKHLLSTIAKQLRDSNRPNGLKNGVPGRMWFRKFKCRHPGISEYVINRFKPSRPTEQTIRTWFSQTEQYFRQKNLLGVVKDPSRIFNCDEIGLVLSPAAKQAIVRRSSNEDDIVDFDKEYLTVVVNLSASGSVLPSMVVYSGAKSVPSPFHGWHVSHSETGWLDVEAFSQYIIDCFYPWLLNTNTKFPVILFLDGSASYISPTLLKFCQEKGIILVGVLSNTMLALQPLEAAVFKPVEQSWRTVIRNFCYENNCPLTRTNFASQVKFCFDHCITSRTIETGFKTSGLYPFGCNHVNYSKLPLKNRSKTNESFCE